MHLIGKNKREATFNELMVEVLPEFMKGINSQFKYAQMLSIKMKKLDYADIL